MNLGLKLTIDAGERAEVRQGGEGGGEEPGACLTSQIDSYIS